MAPICKKCDTTITTKSYLTCAICEESYDVDCTSVSFARFRIMTKKNKNEWVCQTCRSKKPPRQVVGTQNVDNVTTRKKIAINVQTSNSYNSLLEDDDDDVDQSLSSASSDDDDTEIVDLNRSCPERPPCYKSDIEDMEKIILDLQSKLTSAESEIDNLSLENTVLSKQLQRYELQIKALKNISSRFEINSSSRTSTKKQGRKTRTCGKTLEYRDIENVNKELNKSFIDLNISPHTVNKIESPKANSSQDFQKDKNSASTPETILQNKDNAKSPPLLKQPPVKPKVSVGDTKTNPKRKIFIVGDESVSGLSAKLTNSRKGKWNDVFTTTALIRPGAQSSTILEYLANTEESISAQDVVVLGVGSYDTNPRLLHSDLCVALSRLRHATVIVTPVTKNCSLNVFMLNQHLRFWTSYFTNCTFIDDTNCYNLRKESYLSLICDKINSIIDCHEYNKQFLSIKNLKKLMAKTDNDNLLVNDTPKKGTIPYYFRKQSRLCPQDQFLRDSTQSNTTSEKCKSPKKGTIPYYFKKHNTLNPAAQLFRAPSKDK